MKALREIRGNLTQVEFAKLAKISRGSLAELEVGHKQPSVGVLVRLCNRLNISMHDLLGI